MTTALVTGASGFIGQHLVRQLIEAGHEVVCLVRRTSKVDALTEAGAQLRYGDITQPESLAAAVAGVDAVYHLAGLTTSLSAAEFHRVNAEGAANLARACGEQSSPPVLVYVSSLAAAGPSTPRRPRRETDAPAPVSHYGRSKLAGERAAADFAADVPITIVRPPIVFGEGDRNTLAMFRPIARVRVHVVPGFWPQRFSLIHAADLAQLLMLAAGGGTRLAAAESPQNSDPPAAAGLSQGCYFAGCGEQLTYGELGRRMGRALGRRFVLVLPLPKVTTWAVAGASEGWGRMRGRTMPLNLDKAREAVAGSWSCSNELASAELGYQPGASLDERLRQTCDWYREQRWI